MVQIIEGNRKLTSSEKFGEAFSGGVNALSKFMDLKRQKENEAKRNETLQKLTGMDLSALPPEMQAAAFQEVMKTQGKEKLLGQKQEMFQNLFSGGNQGAPQNMGGQLRGDQSEQQMQEMGMPQQGQQQGFNPINIPDEAIAQATMMDPNLGRSLQHAKDVALREKREGEKAQRKEFEGERKYHTEFSKEIEKEADVLRSVIPKKEYALNFARNSIETGDLGYFSPDKLADATGIDLFRTAKGAQLLTAGKENLLSNMSRVGSKAQNMWFEQRLNSMFPRIGQSEEANLTTLEMLEGELEMDKAYLGALDRLSNEDQEKYGFVRKDIKKRAQDSVKGEEKEILKRTSYRMKQIEENETGLSKLKGQVGNNVVEGTPMTLAMAKLYKDKFGENALKVAQKNGYYIPTIEEFETYQKRPMEVFE